MERTDTAAAILDAAQELVQTRGYNAFSYRDLAARVGIRTASIHYHFPAKADLGTALVARYGAEVRAALGALAARGPDAPGRLRGYVRLLEGVLAPPGTGPAGGGRVCLGGMLASDYATLPAEVQHGVAEFVADNVRWLAQVLAEGRASGTLAFAGDPATAATALFAALEGAMFVARTAADAERYRATGRWLVDALVAPTGAPAP